MSCNIQVFKSYEVSTIYTYLLNRHPIICGNIFVYRVGKQRMYALVREAVAARKAERDAECSTKLANVVQDNKKSVNVCNIKYDLKKTTLLLYSVHTVYCKFILQSS